MEKMDEFKALVLDVWTTPVLGSDVGALVTALGIVLFFMFFAKKIGRLYGIIGLIIYVCYMYFIFI